MAPKKTETKDASKEVKETKPDSKSKTVKEEKVQEPPKKKVVEKVVVEDVDSDEESEDDYSDSGSEMESGDEQDDVKQTQKSEATKEKKAKQTWQELSAELEEIETALKENEKEKKTLDEQCRQNDKKRSELERRRVKTFSKIDKVHTDEVKKAHSEKPKRKGNKDGGFNKELPVPPKLVKYLGLTDDIKMSRPKVMSMLNEKFKGDGLKEGQVTTLDKDAAKALGKEKGRVIEFTAFQSFLKEFYEEAFPDQFKQDSKESKTVKM